MNKEKSHAKAVAWSCDMEGHAKKCVERHCKLANQTVDQLFKVSTPCLDDHHFKKKKELKTVGELSKVCSQIVLKCLFLARMGRPDILWSENKLAKLRRACDRSLVRFISYIRNTRDYRQYCHVGKTAQHCRLELLPDSDFAGDIEDFKSSSK